MKDLADWSARKTVKALTPVAKAFVKQKQRQQRGLSNTPDLSPMEEGHEQPDTPDVSSRET